MRRLTRFALTATAISALASPAEADSFTGSAYKAGDLLEICRIADNDARNGVFAEIECEQYIMGFADALREVGQTGPEAGICPPEINTADEIRWAYMKWVNRKYTERTAMPAADALLATLKDSFVCE